MPRIGEIHFFAFFFFNLEAPYAPARGVLGKATGRKHSSFSPLSRRNAGQAACDVARRRDSEGGFDIVDVAAALAVAVDVAAASVTASESATLLLLNQLDDFIQAQPLESCRGSGSVGVS